MRQKMLLLAAVFFGILAFVLTYQQLQSEKEKIRGEAEFVYVIKLTKDLAENEEIREADITREKVKRFRAAQTNSREIPWDKNMMIIGRKMESGKSKGDYLQWDDLKPASRRFTGITGKVRPGFRAVSIPVDSTSSVTNLVNPDDHVDIIGTFRFPEMRGDQALDTITMTILQNVKVLATGSNGGVGDSQQPMRSYRTVTLELTPKEVEMMICASQTGRLSLSLRNYEETRFEKSLQSVNFKYLENNVGKYNEEREVQQKKY